MEDDDALKKVMNHSIDYLYKIDGEVTDQQYQIISTIRQLINECYYPTKQVSNQFLYDHLKELL